nr:DUF3892 domain-containing protein [Piscinibacter sp. XHJ-5]
MSGGSRHEHITTLWWDQVDNGTVLSSGQSSREQMVEFIEANGNNIVWCPDRDPAKQGAWVHVQSNARIKYVQTLADGRTTDNLLSLPDR